MKSFPFQEQAGARFRGPRSRHDIGQFCYLKVVKLPEQKGDKIVRQPFRAIRYRLREQGPGKRRRLKRRQERWLKEIEGPLTLERIKQLWSTPCSKLQKKLARSPKLPDELLLPLLQGEDFRRHAAAADAWENPNTPLYLLPTAGSTEAEVGMLTAYLHSHPNPARHPHLYSLVEEWWQTTRCTNAMLSMLFYRQEQPSRSRCVHVLLELARRAMARHPELGSKEHWVECLRRTARRVDRFRRFDKHRLQPRQVPRVVNDSALLTQEWRLTYLLQTIEDLCRSGTGSAPTLYLKYDSDLQLTEALSSLLPDEHLPSLIRQLQPTLPPYPS